MPSTLHSRLVAVILGGLSAILFALAMPAGASPTDHSVALPLMASPTPVTAATSPTVAPSPPAPTLTLRVSQADDSKFPQVTAYAGVTGEGGAPLAGMLTADFALLEDDRPVASFEVTSTVNTQEPLSVALVLDISGSMQGKSLDYARQAAISFLDTLGPRDAVELISFSSEVKVNLPFTTSKPIVAKGIENLRAAGDTALYDAVVVAVDRLGQLAPGRKLAVLLTDGEDTASKRRLDAALATIAQRRVPVFAVGLGDQVDRGVLERITGQSGGNALFAPSAIDLMKAYRTIGDQLRSQYVLRFVSGLKADGREHRLAVRLTRAPATRDGLSVFHARQNPPWLDIVTPKPAKLITATQQIEVNVLPGAPGATIQQVDFAVDAQPIGSSKAAPHGAALDPARFSPGEHVLRVTALDSAGNTTSHEINFRVPAPPVIEPTPVPTAVPTPTAIPEPAPAEPAPAPAPDYSLLWILGLALPVGVGLVVAVRKRRPKTLICPRCGTLYTVTYCPTCALEDRELLLRRLRQVTSGEPRDGGPGSAK